MGRTSQRTNRSIDITVSPEIAEAIALMLRSHISGVPVLDMFVRRLSELVTLSDAEATEADCATREKIFEEIDFEIGRLKGLVRIDVHHGVVEIRGVITDERQHRRLREIASSAPGVLDVHDHLVWIDPTTGAFLEPTEEAAASNPPT